MRTIKFRAFSKHSNQWCYFHIPNLQLETQWRDSEDYQWHSEYSGLKDRLGLEIYEWDICKVPAMNWLGAQEIRFEQAAFKFGVQPLVNLYGQEFEVIGNIYENPELLPATPQPNKEER